MTSRTGRTRAALCALVATLTVFFITAPAGAERTRRGNVVARRGPAVTRLAPEERRALAVERFMRADGIRRCWARQLYRDPTSPSRRLVVSVSVDREGRIASVQVRDNVAPTLASCIAATSYVVAPVGPGEAFEAQATLTLERGE